MFPILQLGPLAIQVPGLFLLAGVWVAVSLIERQAARRKVSPEALSNLVLYGLIAGILGARLGYAARFLNVYLENPLSLFSLNPSTLAPLDGMVAGLVAATIYGQRKKLPLWPTLDALAPGLAAFSVALGFAHLASGDAFGAPTDLPWGVQLWGARRHPTQIYEIGLAGLVSWAVLRVARWRVFPGFTFLAWLALTAAARLFLEAFRGDSVVILGVLRQAQVLSLVALLAALGGMSALARGKEQVSGNG
jgi:prolipoprotein diacylglyceryltransferase